MKFLLKFIFLIFILSFISQIFLGIYHSNLDLSFKYICSGAFSGLISFFIKIGVEDL